MRSRKLILGLSAASLTLFGCGGDGGGENVAGVWIGNYTVQLSSQQTGNAPKGPVCLELTQNGSQVSGKGWVGGYLWESNFNGTISGNAFRGTVTGQTLGNSQITVNFDGTVTSNQISGTVTVNGNTYNVNLSKDENKTECGWASRELVFAFGEALGRAYGGSDDHFVRQLISFISEVPTIDVNINGQTYQNWWACIWEIRNKVTPSSPTEITLGAIINPQKLDPNGNIEFAMWQLYNTDPNIGLDINFSSQPINENFDSSAPGTGSNGAYYVYRYAPGSSKYILLDATLDDEYKNEGTVLSGEPFFVSECLGTSQYKVWMTQIPFYVRFSGDYMDSGTRIGNGSFSSPPNAPASTVTIPALYIEVNQCTP